MAKQLNIDLKFNADTSQVQKNLQDLQQNLKNLGSININTGNVSNDLKTAVLNARELDKHLTKAFNQKTGNISLDKLSRSLKQSNTSLSQLTKGFANAGLTGEKAFLQVHSAIASANLQLTKSKSVLGEFLVTLKNTARWQLSSSVLHGLMGSVSSAYNYAQKLDKSLNNIRIVTGKSADEMAKFAQQANKAAKELSTTTTRYTDASLIYYQQGLKEEDVKARTEITMKMAAVAGESAQVVSDQMTAVWNNFYDGSESLESYSDKMTALGAATASSTSEISEGLNKFAAISNTVGLSFDYAASALATVTAQTRQSADIVGTAFKTMFARIQGLKLGDTLEDGTTLNKYSEALASVGVNIKTADGQLKDMDTILSEMAGKWQTISKDSQVALAQTVAGTRQYTQLVALMDNWDFMEENLKTIEKSNGTLQKQFETYEEGWEAASNRVRASFETIYKELVPEESFKGILDGFAGILDVVGSLTKAIGGLKGALLLAGSIALKHFGPQLGQSLQNTIDKVSSLSLNLGKHLWSFKTTGHIMSNEELAQQEMLKDQAENLAEAKSQPRMSESFKVQRAGLEKVNELTQIITKNSAVLTEEQQKQLQNEIEQVKVLSEKRGLLVEQKEILEQQQMRLSQKVASSYYADGGDGSGFELDYEREQEARIKNTYANLKESYGIKGMGIDNGRLAINSQYLGGMESTEAVEALITSSSDYITQLNTLDERIRSIKQNFPGPDEVQKIEAITKAIDETSGISEKLKDHLKQALSDPQNGATLEARLQKLTSLMNQEIGGAKALGKALGLSNEEIREAANLGIQFGAIIEKNKQSEEQYGQGVLSTTEKIQNSLKNAMSTGHSLARGFSDLSSVAMSLSSLNNAMKTFHDESASGFDKFTAATMAGTMAVRAYSVVLSNLDSVFTALNSTKSITNAIDTSSLALSKKMTAQQVKENMGTILEQQIKKGTNHLSQEQIAHNLVYFYQKKYGIKLSAEDNLIQQLALGLKGKDIKLTEGQTAATIFDTVARRANAKAMLLQNKYLLVGIAALAVVGAGIIAYVNAEKKAAEARKKAAEMAQKEAEASREEVKTNEELIKSYNSLVETFKKNGEGRDELNKKSKELIEAFNIEGGTIMYLRGEYDKLAEAAERARIAQLKEANEKTKTALATTGAEAGDIIREGEGQADGNGRYYRILGSDGRDSKMSSDEAAAAATYSKDYKYIDVTQGAPSQGGGRFRFNLENRDDPKELIAYYEEIQDWIEKQRQYAEDNGIDINESEVYNDAINELGKLEEVYGRLKSLQDQNLTEKLSIWSEEGKASEVKSFEDYQNFEKELIEKYVEETGKEGEEAAKDVRAYLSILPGLSDYATEQSGFEELGIDNKDIINYYESLPDSAKTIFWTLDINKEKSLEDIKESMAEMQDYIYSQQLQVSLNTSDDLIELLSKKKLTEKDQGQVQELYSTFAANTPGAISWEEFTQKSKEDQLAYIQTMTQFTTSTLNQITSEILNTAPKKVEQAESELKALQDRLLEVNSNSYIPKEAKSDMTDSLGSQIEAKQREIDNLKDSMVNAQQTRDNLLNSAFEEEITSEGFDPEEVELYAEALGMAEDQSEATQLSIKRLALENKKLNKGIQLLADDYDELSEVLKDSSNPKYYEGIKKVQTAFEDIFGVKPDTKFIEANLKDIMKLASGDISVLDELQKAVSADYIVKISGAVDVQGLQGEFLDLNNIIQGLDLDSIKIGTEIDPALADKLQSMLDNFTITKEQANAILSGIGYSPDITMKRVDVKEAQAIEGTTKSRVLMPDGTYKEVETTSIHNVDGQAYIEVPTIGKTTTKFQGSSLGGGVSKPTSKKKSGGGSKPKQTKKSDVVDRYKEVTDQLDDVKNAMEDVNKASDRMYGESKLKAMEKANKLLKEETSLLEKKKKEAIAYLAEDKQTLANAASTAGVNLTLDDNGNISNYTSVMNGLFEQLKSAEDSGGNIEATHKKIDDLKFAIKQYDETRELIEDLDDQLIEQFNQWQDRNAEKLSYELELKLEINDMDFKEIDYYLDKISDNFFKMAEGAALTANKLPLIRNNLESVKNYGESLKSAFGANDISQNDYIEGMKQGREEILENLSALNSLDKEMLEYYGNTLDAAGEEIAKYTSLMNNQTRVLEHFVNVMDILGESTDYNKMGAILEGQQHLIKNELKIAQNEYEMYSKEADNWKTRMDAAIENSPAWEIYKENWMKASEACNEAHDRMLSKVEQFAEQAKAILENKLKGYNKSLEEKLTGGTSFEEMNKDFERANTLQEEYLTTTNKIYETNKLMRTAQEALDKSNNKLAKNKLKQFMEETKALQEHEKLSKFELEIQQAKYDLTLAEIALEEAKNAKSKVRLTRNSEGNFSYVYTSDDEKTSESQQKLEDAQNNLYNISLEGANRYSDKYRETLNNMYNDLTSLQEKFLSGEFASQEEYDQAITKTQEYYYKQLAIYSNQYQIALQTDSTILDGIWKGNQNMMLEADEIWSQASGRMTTASEEWKKAVSGHVDNVSQAFQDWQIDMETVKQSVGENLDSLKDKVSFVTKESDTLTDTINNKVIPTVENEIEEVEEITNKYAELRTTVLELIAEYEKLLDKFSQSIDIEINAPNEIHIPITYDNPGMPAPQNSTSGTNSGRTDDKNGSDKKGQLSYHRAGSFSGEINPERIQKSKDKQYLKVGENEWISIRDINNSTNISQGSNGIKLINPIPKYEYYNTGGYTGDWGPEGKLAVLHEKEIVLNKDDTSNLLHTIGMTKQIINAINFNAQAASRGLGNIVSSPVSTGDNKLNQNVTITAEFPNATEHSEIEEAFNNLINEAAQYANRIVR